MLRLITCRGCSREAPAPKPEVFTFNELRWCQRQIVTALAGRDSRTTRGTTAQGRPDLRSPRTTSGQERGACNEQLLISHAPLPRFSTIPTADKRTTTPPCVLHQNPLENRSEQHVRHEINSASLPPFQSKV